MNTDVEPSTRRASTDYTREIIALQQEESLQRSVAGFESPAVSAICRTHFHITQGWANRSLLIQVITAAVGLERGIITTPVERNAKQMAGTPALAIRQKLLSPVAIISKQSGKRTSLKRQRIYA